MAHRPAQTFARSFFCSAVVPVLAACASEPPPAAQVPVAPPVVAPAPPVQAAPLPVAVAPRPAPKEPPFAEVMADAAAHSQPILLFFHTVWCKPCAEMEANVFPRPEVAAALGGYRMQKYDAELGEGSLAAKRFAVSSFPTLLVVSTRGDEIERVRGQDAASIVRALVELRPVALRVPVPDEAVARETDARALLITAGVVAKAGDADRAGRAYRAAIAKDTDPKKPIAAEAALALLRLDTRTRDARSHGKVLVDFAPKYPGSDEAITALRGLTLLPATDRPDRAALRRAAGAVIAAQRASKQYGNLRPLAASLTTLGDPDDAAKAVADLPSEPPLPPGVVMFVPPVIDPLAEACPSSTGMSSAPPEYLAMFERMTEIGHRIAGACSGVPRGEDEEEVRLYVKDARVERALLLDPEASAPLRACIEAAARLEVDLPPLFGEKKVVTVRFLHSK